MKAIFTTAGPTADTIADYTATPRRHGVLRSWSMAALVQKEPGYFAVNPLLLPRGNTSGQIVIEVQTSYSSYDNAATALKADQALVGLPGSLVLTPVPGTSSVLYTMANAILSRVDAKQSGVQTTVAFTFDITTVT